MPCAGSCTAPRACHLCQALHCRTPPQERRIKPACSIDVADILLQGYAQLTSSALPEGTVASPFGGAAARPLFRLDFKFLGEYNLRMFENLGGGPRRPAGRSIFATFRDGDLILPVRPVATSAASNSAQPER